MCAAHSKKCSNLFSPNDRVRNVFLAYIGTCKESECKWKKVCSVVLSSLEFARRFKFVAWFSARLTTMEQWGSSCNCHQVEWLAGVKYECAHRGRLLPYAHEYAQTQFASLIDEARQWDARYWGCMDFLRVCMGVVHSTVSRGNLKLAFVDRAPYIFANLGFKDGIRERAIEQFASAPLEKHNRNSIAICTPGTDLNDAVMAMTSFDDLSDPLYGGSFSASV